MKITVAKTASGKIVRRLKKSKQSKLKKISIKSYNAANGEYMYPGKKGFRKSGFKEEMARKKRSSKKKSKKHTGSMMIVFKKRSRH